MHEDLINIIIFFMIRQSAKPVGQVWLFNLSTPFIAGRYAKFSSIGSDKFSQAPIKFMEDHASGPNHCKY